MCYYLYGLWRYSLALGSMNGSTGAIKANQSSLGGLSITLIAIILVFVAIISISIVVTNRSKVQRLGRALRFNYGQQEPKPPVFVVWSQSAYIVLLDMTKGCTNIRGQNLLFISFMIIWNTGFHGFVTR